MQKCDRTGKRLFATERDAKDELAKLIRLAMIGQRPGAIHRSDTDATLECGVYRCRWGDHFHLSSRPDGGRIVNA